MFATCQRWQDRFDGRGRDEDFSSPTGSPEAVARGAVAGLVGIECGVVSGVINLESSGVEASDWRPRHDEHYHEA
jgi:hypothetical protein